MPSAGQGPQHPPKQSRVLGSEERRVLVLRTQTVTTGERTASSAIHRGPVVRRIPSKARQTSKTTTSGPHCP